MELSKAKRKLAAILSARVQGYSRLMGEDEEGTIHTLTLYRGVISTLVQQHNGRVVDSPGDNLLAEFGSVVDALRCAVAIQQELRERNALLPLHKQMNFRIGLNLGDVIAEDERLYGDGVNIAARLEGLAEGGGICISGTVYDQVENKLPFVYESLGEQTVKNIVRPVRVYRVTSTSPHQGSGAGEQATRNTGQMAVLPVLPIPDVRPLGPALVGRDAELAQLHKRLENALRGERQIIFVTGEPGIGN
jgi:adenylate cyclase